MKLKACITLLIAFVAVCVLSDFLFTRFIVYGTPTSGSGCIHRIYQEHDGEIPIFGPSRARSNYDLKELGLNAFSYGLDGISFDVTDALLQIELAKHKTGPIIIDVQVAGMSGLGNTADYIPYATDPRFRDILNHYHSMEWRYYIPGIRYFGYYDWYIKDFIKYRIQTAGSAGGRFAYEDRPFGQATFREMARLRSQTSLGYHPDTNQDQRLLAHIVEHPERLFILVYSPLHSSCYARFENADKFEAYKKSLNSMSNVVVIDWGHLDYPDDFFKDTIHLSQKGAADFSQRLGEKIRGILQDRNELQYASSNAAKETGSIK